MNDEEFCLLVFAIRKGLVVIKISMNETNEPFKKFKISVLYLYFLNVRVYNKHGLKNITSELLEELI